MHPDPLTHAPWRSLVALGDATIDFADELARSLRAVHPQLDYRNLGARGLLTEEVREVQLGAALARRPDLAVLSTGTSDLLGPGFDGAGVEEELEAMVGALRARGAAVVTVGLLNPGAGAAMADRFRAPLTARVRELAARTEVVAQRHGAWHVDLSAHPAAADARLWSRDGRHPNAEGHALLAAETLRALRARIQEVPAAASAAARAPRRRRRLVWGRPAAECG
jgi:lysophospholipase L1-like esterase